MTLSISRNQPNPKRRIAAGQRAAGLFLLGVLVAVAGGVLWVQARFDPAQWRLQPGWDSVGNEEPLDHAAAADPPADAVEGLRPLTPAETYTAETLSDKINGKAELYLSAGFQSLQTRRFAWVEDAAVWMERYVYDMGAYRNAFAVFSAQRRPNAESLGLTPDAYAAANGLFLVHGVYYVEIIAAQDSAEARAACVALARAFIRNQPEGAGTPGEPALFPLEHRVADSFTLVADHAFGIDGFDWVYTALYQKNGAEVLAFLSERSSPAAARELAAAFEAHFIEYGGRSLDLPGLPAGARMVNVMDFHEIVAAHDVYVYGVHEGTDPDFALDVFSGVHQAIVEGRR